MANQLASENIAAENPRAVMGGNAPPKAHDLLTTELVETYSEEFKKVEGIAARANALPEKVASEDDLKALTTVYLDASELFKSIDGSRLSEQRPVVAVFKTVFGPHCDRLDRMMTVLRGRSDDYNREKVRRERAEREAEQAKLRAEAERKRQEAQIAAEFGDVDGTVEAVKEASHVEDQLASVATSAPTTADVARVRTDDGGLSTAKGEWKFEITDYSKVDLNLLKPYLATKDVEKAISKAVRALKEHTKIEGVRVYEDVATQFRR
jgi:hypothetical protein